jgi:hypothetical protein
MKTRMGFVSNSSSSSFICIASKEYIISAIDAVLNNEEYMKKSMEYSEMSEEFKSNVIDTSKLRDYLVSLPEARKWNGSDVCVYQSDNMEGERYIGNIEMCESIIDSIEYDDADGEVVDFITEIIGEVEEKLEKIGSEDDRIIIEKDF